MTQVVFPLHGGGSLPLLGNPNHIELIQHLRQLSQNWEAPKQILVISGHWETSVIQITHHSNPLLLYDYKALVFSYLISITNRQCGNSTTEFGSAYYHSNDTIGTAGYAGIFLYSLCRFSNRVNTI